MEDPDHFFALDRWQIGVDGSAAENGGGQGPTDELALSNGGENMMGFMSPPHTSLAASPPMLPLESLHPSTPNAPERPVQQEWPFHSNNWAGFQPGLSNGIHCSLSAPNAASTYNLLPSKVILPPHHNGMLLCQPHQLQPSHNNCQVVHGKFGGNPALKDIIAESGSGPLPAGKAAKRIGCPSIKDEEEADPAYHPGSSLSGHKSRKRGPTRRQSPADSATEALNDTEATTLLPSALTSLPPSDPEEASQIGKRRSTRQAASDNKFCPGPEDTKGKSRNSRTKSSNYRGVTKHRRSGRYEAHLWIRELHRQVYLGGYEHEEHAAEAYDVAALKSKGMNVKTNFDISRYSDLTACMHSISLEELIMAVRRQSQGFSRGSSTFRGVTHHPSGRWEARIGIPGSKHIYLGLHDDEDSAARAYDSALVRLRGTVAATNFSLSDYRTELSDYHRKQQEILEKGNEESICTGDAFEDWIKSGYRDSPSSEAAVKTSSPSVVTRRQPRRAARSTSKLVGEGGETDMEWRETDNGTAEATVTEHQSPVPLEVPPILQDDAALVAPAGLPL